MVTYKGRQISLKEGQSVLDALLAEGYDVPHGCQQGVCHSCLLRAESGTIPEKAQAVLKPTQQEQGYFLSCLCQPQDDLSIVECEGANTKEETSLLSCQPLTPSIYALRFKVSDSFSYRAGQYINVIRPSDQLARSYSLASIQAVEGQEIEVHIKVFEGGEMSTWLKRCALKTPVEIAGPMGDCFYLPRFKEKDLLLLGYSTGLAPLYGILKEALYHGHTGQIHLYHWGNNLEDLYYQEKLEKLARHHASVFYTSGLEVLPPEVAEEPQTYMSGEACAEIMKTIPSLKDWKIFLCGSEAKVNKARRVFYLAGANLSDIYADAFFTWQTSDSAATKAS